MPLRARIALFGTGVVALALIVFGLLADLLFSATAPGEQDKLLSRRAEAAVADVATDSPASFKPHRADAPIDLRDSDNDDAVFVVITGAAGAAIVGTGEMDGFAPSFDPTLLHEADDGSAKATVDLDPTVEVRVAIRPWSRADLGLSGYVVAGQSTAKREADLLGIRVFIAIAVAIALVVAFIASWRVAGRALKPLRTILTTVDEIGASGDLSRRLPPVRQKDELGRLTASFNALLERVEASQTGLANALANEQRLVADASHELRTPLTSIRANADFLLTRPEAAAGDREAALRDIAQESEEMSRLVHDLLTLARADAGQHVALEPLDLGALVQDSVRLAQRRFPGRDIVAVATPPLTNGTRVAGDATTLRRLLWILIENAVKHTPDSGRIRLSLGVAAGRATLHVIDEGPGIPLEDLERIFERFYQADAARGGGAGLGLAIARWIAVEHGGALAVRNNRGPGATFELDLPVFAPVSSNS